MTNVFIKVTDTTHRLRLFLFFHLFTSLALDELFNGPQQPICNTKTHSPSAGFSWLLWSQKQKSFYLKHFTEYSCSSWERWGASSVSGSRGARTPWQSGCGWQTVSHVGRHQKPPRNYLARSVILALGTCFYREPSCTVSGYVNSCSFGERYRGPLKNKQK